MRKRSRAGRAVGVLLPLGATLGHGNVLAEEPDVLVVVNLIECEVIVTQPRDAREMAVLALELGNLHVPVEISGDALLTLPDGPVEAVLERYRAAYSIERRRFTPVAVAGTRVRVASGLNIVRTRS